MSEPSMLPPDGQIWVVILALGLGSFALRFLFLGLLGGRALPLWAMRLLRYTPAAVIPALVVPIVIWPYGVEAGIDIRILLASIVTLVVGFWRRDTLWAVVAGGFCYFIIGYFL